jgi:hypothetical protein
VLAKGHGWKGWLQEALPWEAKGLDALELPDPTPITGFFAYQKRFFYRPCLVLNNLLKNVLNGGRKWVGF